MSWKKLRAGGKVRPHKASKKELDELRAVIARDLEDAAIPGSYLKTVASPPPTTPRCRRQKWPYCAPATSWRAHLVITDLRSRRRGSRLELLPPVTLISLKPAGASAT